VATPRDRARARRFALSQAAAALTGPAATSRRASIATGAAIAAVSLTVAASVGLFGSHRASAQPAASPSPSVVSPSPSPVPSAATWQRGNAVIVDATSGARYVYRGGELRPLRNAASASLIFGAAHPPTVSVAHADLVAARIGAPIGIAGLPTLPSASAMLGGGWVVCSTVSSGSPTVHVVAPAGGSFSTDAGFSGYGSALGGGSGLGSGALLISTGGVDYLVLEHRLSRIEDPTAVFAAWKWAGVEPLPVVPAVIDALPAGPAVTTVTPKPTRVTPTATSTFCVSLGADGSAAHTVLNASVSHARLALPAHHGVLVRAGSKTYLVIASGTAYALADAAARNALGYHSAPVVSVPAGVLAAVPKGPTLSRTAALHG
jgi:hypothetical protein